MKIDITKGPPVEIFRDRGKHLTLFIGFLGLAACSIFLGMFVIFSDTGYSEKMESASLALLVGGAVGCFYFGEKVQKYKRLNPKQTEELSDLGRNYSEIGSYLAQVRESGRQPIMGEYEASRDWAEESERQQAKKQKT